MTIQYGTTCRNAKLDAVNTFSTAATCTMRIYSGAQPANCAAANAGTLIWSMTLPNPHWSAAATGSMAKTGTWSATASAGAVAGHFRLYNSTATMDGTTCFMQGSVGQGTGDLSLDNSTIANGQTVTINTFTINDNNP